MHLFAKLARPPSAAKKCNKTEYEMQKNAFYVPSREFCSGAVKKGKNMHTYSK